MRKNWKMIVMTVIATLFLAVVVMVIETQIKNPMRLAKKRVASLRVIEEEARLTYQILKYRSDTAKLPKPVPKTE